MNMGKYRKEGISMKNIVVITGASSGFGEQFALSLDARLKSIDEYWLIARNTEKMEEISKAMSTPCKILSCDLATVDGVKKVIKAIERESDECYDKLHIKMLINSAGFGKLGEFVYADDNDITGMIDVNIRALTCITKGLLPYMAHNSRIINFSSATAFLPQPQFAEYAATKAYVLSFSRALNAELEKYGISVLAVCPGPAATNFFNVAEEHGKSPWYKKMFMADPKKIVDKAIHDSINRYEVSVYGGSMKALRIVAKLLPKRLMIKLMSRK